MQLMKKSEGKSFFLNMHRSSPLSDKVFGCTAMYEEKEIVVLQVLPDGEDWLVVEVIFRDDYKPPNTASTGQVTPAPSSQAETSESLASSK